MAVRAWSVWADVSSDQRQAGEKPMPAKAPSSLIALVPSSRGLIAWGAPTCTVEPQACLPAVQSSSTRMLPLEVTDAKGMEKVDRRKALAAERAGAAARWIMFGMTVHASAFLEPTGHRSQRDRSDPCRGGDPKRVARGLLKAECFRSARKHSSRARTGASAGPGR